jgi:hypothetical protein
MKDKPEPGWYWACIDDELKMISINSRGSIDIVRPAYGPRLDAMPDGAIRIPSAEELVGEQGWVKHWDIVCPKCESRQVMEIPGHATWQCFECQTCFEVETKYRVKP